MKMLDWLKRKKKVYEDYKKIQKKLEELNKGEDGSWYDVDDFHSMTRTTIQSIGKSVFYTNQGLTMKVFANKDTGEIKFFPYTRFLK